MIRRLRGWTQIFIMRRYPNRFHSKATKRHWMVFVRYLLEVRFFWDVTSPYYGLPPHEKNLL